ncbi:class I SAM-dependent methyltransferase [Skermania sp. ID1734]|uniref:class I SAM-dependent methyltransferase n=1 Tax=Skermania sp. ID1734 TaxID=2597516 RepID=UPI00117BE34F|nr:class I SAM-dependent methyltransferase [Skermania sp. ID1734]TSE00437.1 class I SAM-dependent methyltransferase [Skermania sp. ID1734]
MTDLVRVAYSALADRYISGFGSLDHVHQDDLGLLEKYLVGVSGPVVDAGCGPGHLTAHLVSRGVDARGIDLVPEFIGHARNAHPCVPFQAESFMPLPADDDDLAGIIAWYSLIHLQAAQVCEALTEFHRALAPEGVLVLGFFDGDDVEPFDHKVTVAYRWPLNVMAELVNDHGFTVAETLTRTDPGHRPHAALVARKVSTGHNTD